MPNVILTHDMLAQRALFDLKNELTFSRNVFTGYREEFHAVGGFKKGNSVRVQLPNRFRAKKAVTVDPIELEERNTTVTVDIQAHVAFALTGQQLTFEIEDLSRKVIKPAIIALANQVDADGLAEYVNIYNMVGSPGTTPSDFSFLTAAAERLDNEAISREGRVSVLSPKAHWSMADGELKTVFQQNMVDTLIRKGFIGRFALMDFFMDQNVVSHTVGTRVSDTGAVATTSSEGATTLALKGFTENDQILQGDIITVDSVAGVNPISGQVWENAALRQFVATADLTIGSGGTGTLSISPKIYSSAANEDFLPIQTVNDLPAANDVVTIVSGASGSSHPQNMFFHPHAFALTMVPIARPMSANKSVMWGSATDEDLGLAVTVSTDWNSVAFSENTRIDVLYGWDTIEPEYCVRGTG